MLESLQSPRPSAPRTLAVGGGKGGVGKTFLVANLSAALAGEGFRVVAVDTDLEGANLHTWLGVVRPRVSLADYVAQRERDLGKLLLDTPVPNLRLIAASGAHLGLPQPRHFRRIKLLRALRQLPADFVLVDLGAGVHPPVMDYFLVSDEGMLVLTPEPTAVENAYAFLRAAFYRRLRLAMSSPAVRELVRQAMDQRNERGIRTPLDLMREVRAIDPAEGARFAAVMHAFRPGLVVNGVRSAADIRLGFAVRSACRKVFGLEAEYLGYVNDDEAVRAAVLARRPVVLHAPRSDAAIYVRRIARKLGMRRARPGTSPGGSPS